MISRRHHLALACLAAFGLGGADARAQDGPLVRPPENGFPLDRPTAPEAPSETKDGAKKKSDKPTGMRVGEETANSYVIDDRQSVRVPVYPDDPDSPMWEISPHVAFAQAQRQQRPLFLLFTGSWNAKCLALSEQVFTTKSFNQYVKDNAIVCYINYPRNITDAIPAARAIKEKFKVMGYPTLLIFDPDGNVDQEIRGYNTDKPVEYFNRLKYAAWPLLERIAARKRQLRARGYRDWTNTEGRTFFGRFVDRDDQVATLLGADGRAWPVEIAKLGEADRALVHSFPSVGEIAALREKTGHPPEISARK
ncbi:MAG: thioredoxin family protein [Verrucomicrobiae bacterium]|nr:thioredoxin family protein [Verrucomicrobiae bacterium]MCP5539218.1 thioredoxin family protein [Akkermansiaceae bacterium]MCP5549871.1 thioredoxin family protein [Akkermansiaceae bacterium]